MNKNIVVVMMAGALVLGGLLMVGTTPVVAQEKAAAKAVDAGNKICPVMGGEVAEDITVEYKGKLYHLCCPMCVQTFDQDPEKYSKIADDEVAAKPSK